MRVHAASTAAALLALAAPGAMAAPVQATGAPQNLEPGGIERIIQDHNRFVANPASSTVPGPDETLPVTGHRQAHELVFRLTGSSGGIPPVPDPQTGAPAAAAF